MPIVTVEVKQEDMQHISPLHHAIRRALPANWHLGAVTLYNFYFKDAAKKEYMYPLPDTARAFQALRAQLGHMKHCHLSPFTFELDVPENTTS